VSDEIERRLRQSLRRRADSVGVTADWDDLGKRSERARVRRRRVLTIAVAVCLVGGPVAGYRLARATEAGREPSISAGTRSNAGLAGGGGGGLACTGGSCGPLEPLFRRDVAGVSIRAYRAHGAGSGPCDGAQVVAEVSNANAVAASTAPVEQTFSEPMVATAGVFGGAEGSSATWAIVQLSPELAARASSVQALFAGGAGDEMQPVHDAEGHAVAVLAQPASPGAVTTGKAVAFDASGERSPRRRLDLRPGAATDTDHGAYADPHDRPVNAASCRQAALGPRSRTQGRHRRLQPRLRRERDDRPNRQVRRRCPRAE
jgi:hypothetical protein